MKVRVRAKGVVRGKHYQLRNRAGIYGIRINDLPTGTYTLLITNGIRNRRAKFVKQQILGSEVLLEIGRFVG